MGRVLALAFLVLLALPIFAQGPDWQHVDVYQLDPALAVARLTPAEKRQISRFVSKHLQPDSDECVSMPDGPGPSFYIAPLGRPSLYVVRAGSGCGGANNSPGWLVGMRGGRPYILADIYGWGLGVQPHASHGLHDFVTGWHMAANDFGLSYFRYNGTVYRQIGKHEVISCDGTESTLNNACYKEGGRPRDTTPPEQ